MLAACWPGPRIGEKFDGGGIIANGAVAFSEIQSQVFTRSCLGSSCHEGLPPRDAPMSLETGQGYAEMVGISATQTTGKRVIPGDPANSYLIQKLRGTAQSVGGVATRMPLNAPPLDPATIAAIEAWIARGAPND